MTKTPAPKNTPGNTSYAVTYKGQPIERFDAASPKAALAWARKRYGNEVCVQENVVNGREFK